MKAGRTSIANKNVYGNAREQTHSSKFTKFGIACRSDTKISQIGLVIISRKTSQFTTHEMAKEEVCGCGISMVGVLTFDFIVYSSHLYCLTCNFDLQFIYYVNTSCLLIVIQLPSPVSL